MTAYARSTRKIQIGTEAVQGTKVAATTIWAAPAVGLQDDRIMEHVPEDVGILVPTSRVATYFLGGSLAMPSQAATFEQLPYPLSANIKNVIAGVADGAGTGKIYAYPEPVAGTANTVTTYSLEAGDAAGAEVGEHGFVTEWELSGEGKGPVKMACKWMVRQVAVQAFTAGQAVPTVEEIPFDAGKLWLDDSGGTIATTQKTNTFVRFSLKKSGGYQPSPAGGDGSLFFPGIAYANPKYNLELTWLHDAASISAKAKWRAGTGALIRMQWQGTAFGTPGTGYTYKTLRIDIAGKWLSFDVLDEQDGFETCTGQLVAMRDATAALYCTVTVVNALAALP